MGLRRIEKKELDEIIKLHKKWLDGSDEGIKADLSCADLSGTDLRGVDLRKADLSWTNLSMADLSFADLNGANLFLSGLSDANLNHANLSNANLSWTDLRNADLRRANLCNSYLTMANLKNIKYDEISFFDSICPEKGSFIGYKKSADKIVEIRIEEDSLRSNSATRKCRASKVTVLSITSFDGEKEFDEVSNTGYYNFTYKVGETYEIKDFDTNRWKDSTGIYFFITREEAILYDE